MCSEHKLKKNDEAYEDFNSTYSDSNRNATCAKHSLSLSSETVMNNVLLVAGLVFSDLCRVYSSCEYFQPKINTQNALQFAHVFF